MANWVCPECQRTFGRRNQSHTCVPGLSLEEYFASGAAFERPIYEAVAEHVRELGPVVIEFVTVGIFFRRARTFAELRPMRDRVRLSLLLGRRLQHPRVVRSVAASGLRYAVFIDLRSPAEVDQLRDWLSEAYLSSPVSREGSSPA